MTHVPGLLRLAQSEEDDVVDIPIVPLDRSY